MIKYVSQLDYPQISLATDLHPEWNIEKAGCGICSWYMTVNILNKGENLDLQYFADIANNNDCMDHTGLNIEKYNKFISDIFNLNIKTTDDADIAKKFILTKKKPVIINVNNKFLTVESGHYIVGFNLDDEGILRVLEPYVKDSKRIEFLENTKIGYLEDDILYIPWDYVANATDGKHPAFTMVE